MTYSQCKLQDRWITWRLFKRGNISSKKHFGFLPARCLKCFRNYCLQNAKIWTSWWLICCFRTKPKYLEIGPRKKETFITKISSMLSLVLWNVFFFFRSNFYVHETDQRRFLQMAADHVSGSRPTRKKKKENVREGRKVSSKPARQLFKGVFTIGEATNLRCSDRQAEFSAASLDASQAQRLNDVVSCW